MTLLRLHASKLRAFLNISEIEGLTGEKFLIDKIRSEMAKW